MDTAREAHKTLLTAGKYCESFILSKYSYLMHLDEAGKRNETGDAARDLCLSLFIQVLCRRCGCACTNHEIVGEYGKSQAQWAKENAQRRRRRASHTFSRCQAKGGSAATSCQEAPGARDPWCEVFERHSEVTEVHRDRSYG